MSNLLYPKLSDKLKAANLPEQLDFITDSLDNMLDHILIKQAVTNVDNYSNCTSYYYELGYQNANQETPIQLKVPGTELVLALNKNPNGGVSEFPITVLVDKKAIGLFQEMLSVSQLSSNIINYFKQILKYLRLTGRDLLHSLSVSDELIAGCDDFERVSAILLRIKQFYPLNLTVSDFDMEDTWGNIEKIADAIQLLDLDEDEVVYTVYVVNDNNAVENIQVLFGQYAGDDILSYLRYILTPFIEVHAVLQPSIEIPRSILIPAQNDNGIRKVNVWFGQTELFFSTEGGFGIDSDILVSMENSLIGNTGFSIEITNAKFDLSTTSNIAEAALDNRPNDFVGLYAEHAVIGLPKQWFSGSGLQLVGKNILIGTGGFSGTIGLEATGTMWANIGGFRIGFNKFDLTFKQNAVVSSNIQAKLEIPQFKDKSGNPLQIDVTGHISQSGDFNLTASVAGGIPANLFNFVNFNFLTFELGREGDNFYLGTSCELLNTRTEGIKLHYPVEDRAKNAA